MGEVITNLKAKFGVDTKDFRQGLKDGKDALKDFKEGGSGAISDFAELFGINMGDVTEKIGTAKKAFSFMIEGLKASSGGAKVFAIAMNIVKTALIATGIGAIIVLIGSLIAYFKKTESGATALSRIFMQVKAVLNDLIERAAAFGKGLFEIFTGRFKQGWEDMKGSFKGIGQEIAEDIKKAGELADKLKALEDREIDLITVQGKRQRSIAELRKEAKDLENSEEDRLKKLDTAKGIINAYYADEIALAKTRYELKNQEIDLATKDPTDDQRRELAELQNKVNELYAEQADELRTISREYNALTKSIQEKIAASKEESAQIKKTFQEIGDKPVGVDIDISGMSKQLGKVKDVVITESGLITLDLSNAINNGLNNLTSGFGEFLGNLATGKAGIKDFTALIANTFADMAITVGKLAISTGIAVLGLKAALESMNPYLAIAAGAALVALGTAVKGTLGSLASGGGSGSSAYAGSSAGSAGGLAYTEDKNATGTDRTIKVEGEFKIKGNDLVAVIGKENNRRYRTT